MEEKYLSSATSALTLGAPSTSTINDSYIYSPLPPGRFIRVLKVHGARIYQDPLSFEILQISLDSPSRPDFKAISYCWGGQHPSQKIACGDRKILVTVNCEAALKRFRPSEGETELLWIDGICINQSPDALQERNHQVGMMGDVYASAKEVLVWLGSSWITNLNQRAYQILIWYQGVADAAMMPPEVRQSEIEKAVLDIAETGM